MQPYHWGKSHTSESIASDLVIQITLGVYPDGTLLPALDTLAKQFSASKMTIRRTIWMLNSLGITESVNGVGTKIRVFEEGSKFIQWDNAVIQKNMLQFLWALQLLVIVCRRVTKATLPLMPEEEMSSMLCELEAGNKIGMYHFVYGIWIRMIIKYSNLAAIRDIFGELCRMMVWGFPLRFSEGYMPFSDEMQKLIDSLKRGDRDRFVDVLEQYFYKGFTYCRELMIELGIKDAELPAIPLIEGEFPTEPL